MTELGSMRLSTSVPRLLVVGVGRGREDSQLVAIKEAAKRISLPVTQVMVLRMMMMMLTLHEITINKPPRESEYLVQSPQLQLLFPPFRME